MPISSSTTSICCMVCSLGFTWFSCCGLRENIALRNREREQHPCAAGFDIADGDTAAVFLDDFFHDHQAQAGALGLGGHIGLERALHQMFRKSAAIIGHAKTYG